MKLTRTIQANSFVSIFFLSSKTWSHCTLPFVRMYKSCTHFVQPHWPTTCVPLNQCTSLHPAFKHSELFAACLRPQPPEHGPVPQKLPLIHHCQHRNTGGYTNDHLMHIEMTDAWWFCTGSVIHIFSECTNDPFYELAATAWKTGLHSWGCSYCV